MRPLALPLFIITANALSILASPPVLADTKEREVSFARDVRAVFAEHCLQCHGHDAEQREADLRLDDEESATASAIVRGRPDESPLIERITSRDPDTRMPPGDLPKLGESDVQILRQWIADGARYERHWAFEPVASVPIPAAGENLTDIDQFVVARLKAQNLELSSPASKQHLIRRATFDLTGLPPTWEEVEAFLSDDSPTAFHKVVDRLLDSPRYGERWGRHWLDLARYADTHGGAAIGFKRFAFSYTYRDYVIQAFNEDLPYDQFIQQQLAADQLGLDDNASQLAALGFLTVGQQFRNPHNIIDDQIDVITRGLMGLTVSCARCHDHKFDQVSTKDYYSLYAALASSSKPEELPLIGTSSESDQRTQDQRTQYDMELDRLKSSYHAMAREQSVVMRGRLRMQVGLYLREIAKGAPEPDLVSADVFSYRTDDLRHRVLHRWQTYMRDMPEGDAVFGPWVKLLRFAKDQPQDADGFATNCKTLVAELEKANGDLPNDLHRLSSSAPRWNPRVLESLKSAAPRSMLEVADAYGALFGEVHQEWLHALIATSTEANPGNQPVPDEDPKHLVVNSAVHRQLRGHLYGPDSPTNVPDHLASRMLNRPINDNVNGRRGAIHNLNLNSAGSPPRAMALVEQTAPDPFFIFVRGNPLQRGESVTARFLAALGGDDRNAFAPGTRRLGLAQAIVDSSNPLTRRVIVNWVWQHHFDKGLVRTPDDFGTRGNPPTHPQLLDYLATKLLEDDWSIKKLHRRIMLTQVYQQASAERPAARIVDPNNRWLWRMPRQRLTLEAMRDAMLVASGELKYEVGGRPFELQANPIVPRRSVYAFVNRDIVNPLMSTFDGANPSACTAKRPETTVPQQTLFALNSEFIQDRAAVMVQDMLARQDAVDNQSATDMVFDLYRQTFSREPDQDELATAIGFVSAAETEEGRADRWRQLAHVLLAANEFVFVD